MAKRCIELERLIPFALTLISLTLWDSICANPRYRFQEVVADSAPYFAIVLPAIFVLNLLLLRSRKSWIVVLLILFNTALLGDVTRRVFITGTTFLKEGVTASTSSYETVKLVFDPKVDSQELCPRLKLHKADLYLTRDKFKSEDLVECSDTYTVNKVEESGLNAIISRSLKSAGTLDLGEAILGVSVLRFETSARLSFQVATLSLPKVGDSDEFKLTRLSVRRVATILRNIDRPTVVASDLHSTLWSKWNTMLMRQGRTKSIYRLGSFLYQHDSTTVFLPLVTEHIFVSKGIGVTDVTLKKKGTEVLTSVVINLGVEAPSRGS